MNCQPPFSSAEPSPMWLGEVLSPMTKCSTIEPSWSPTRRIQSRLETNHIVSTVQKTAFCLDVIPQSLLPQLIPKRFHVGDFRKMKKFDQTPYKLPPPTPIHVPAEKRPLEENSLPFCMKLSKVRITPVIRRVSRRPELPMALGQIQPVQIPHVPEPVPILLVPEPPVQIPEPIPPV
ncbi:uncharacterized protein TNCV_3472191 [Trichonephila clavipes]|nr:uncharacterized protein TNCV_3472191 [Trichonephila clavipes]